MASAAEAERFKELYDVERHDMATDCGVLVEDPYPRSPTCSPRRPCTTVPSVSCWATNPAPWPDASTLPCTPRSRTRRTTPVRENQVFSSTFYAGLVTQIFGARTILEMVGAEHRRYRAPAEPAFSPKRAQWWIDGWIAYARRRGVSGFERNGHAELNAELCSRIPLR